MAWCLPNHMKIFYSGETLFWLTPHKGSLHHIPNQRFFWMNWILLLGIVIFIADNELNDLVDRAILPFRRLMAISLMIELKILGVLNEVAFGLFGRTRIEQLVQDSELGTLKIFKFLLEVILLLSSLFFLNHFGLMRRMYLFFITALSLTIFILRISWFIEHVIGFGARPSVRKRYLPKHLQLLLLLVVL